MAWRFSLGIVLIAASGVLVAGCRSSPAPAVAPPVSGSAGVRPQSPPAQISEEDLAEACAHYGTGIIDEMNDDPGAALREYSAAALKDPEDEALVLGVSRRLLQASQPDQALELLIRATEQPGASAAVYARLGIIYSRLGKPDLAIKANRAAIQKDPRLLSGYQNLFVNYIHATRTKDAAALLDKAAAVPDTDPEFLIGLAELYANLGLQAPSEKRPATARALQVLERAGRLKIDDPQLRLKLADEFDFLGKSDRAAVIYQDLLKQAPGDSPMNGSLRAKLADIYLRGHEEKLAAEQLRALIRDNPTDVEAYYWLGMIASSERQYDEALDAFTKALLLKPDFKLGYYELARAQLGADQVKPALETLGKAREKFGQTFALEHLSAIAYLQQKDYTNAYDHFNAAEVCGLAGDSSGLTADFYFEFGATCERKGDYSQAEKYFEKSLRLAPDSAETLNYLGFMLAERGEQLERAQELIDRALKLEPKNSAYLDSKAWVLFKLRQPQQALGYIVQAIQLSEEPDPTVYDHLGDIYAALGQKDKAIEAWRKSLSLDPNGAVRKKIPQDAR